jgi:VanZ family protein
VSTGLSSAGPIELRSGAPAGQAAWAWAYVVLWAGLVLLASSESFSAEHTGNWLSWMAGLVWPGLAPDDLDMVHAIVRKTAHFVEYAVLGALIYRAFFLTWPRQADAARVAASLLLALACASMDEGHQSLIAQRTASLWDVLLDLCGALLGIVSYLLRTRAGRRRSFFFRARVSP